jgi:hypothetical protein
VDQPKAGVAVKYLTPAPLAYRQWDGFTPPPTKEFPNQWHVEASTSEKRTEIGLFSVLVPYRAGQAVPWQAVRLESTESPGVRVTLGGHTTQVVFPSPNAAKLAVKITPES